MSLERDSHHAVWPRAEQEKHTLPLLIRRMPFNIHETRRDRHEQLHRDMGGLAIMSDNLCRELMDWIEDLPARAKQGRDRLVYFESEIDQLGWLSQHRRGLVGREASYWASAFEQQLEYLR